MRTLSAKANELHRNWYVVDATDSSLGRLASKIAHVLRGKHRADFTPHVDTGDFVIVLNAEKVRLTGQKLDQKLFHQHSGYPGGLRSEPYRQMIARRPEAVIERAVKGMLPKGPLGRHMQRKLKVYAGATHPHTAQKPEPLAL